MADPTGRISPQNYAPGEWANALTPEAILGTANPQNYVPASTIISSALVGTAEPFTELESEFLGWRIPPETTAPVISAMSPTGTGVAKDSPVYFETDDNSGGSGVDSDTLLVSIGGIDAIVGGVFQVGWSGTITSDGTGGFDVTIYKDTDFTSYSTVVVDVYVEDFLANSATENWSFLVKDYLGPLVTPLNPLNGEVQVLSNVTLSVQLTDEQGIQPGTSLIEINVGDGGGFDVAWEDGGVPEFKAGWDGPASQVISGAGIKTIYIDPVTLFPSFATVSVRVTSEDVDGNPERLN